MSELENFAAAVFTNWSEDVQHEVGAPMVVADMLDRIFPYAAARRKLGIDVSEDYEALALRLIAEEGGFASVTPTDAAELARVTMGEKLPDLAVLQLLRGAQLSLHGKAKSSAAAPAPKKDAKASPEKWQAPKSRDVVPSQSANAAASAGGCWSCSEQLPAGRAVKFCPHCGADQRQPTCSACNEPLERDWKHCPECGVRVESRE